MNNKGFNMIELMVTVLIIAILAAIGIPQYLKVVEKQKGVEALNIMAAIGKAQERFFIINETYTQEFSDLDADFVDFTTNAAPRGTTLNNRSFAFVINGLTDAAGTVTAQRNDNSYRLKRVYATGGVCCEGNEDFCDTLNLSACE